MVCLRNISVDTLHKGDTEDDDDDDCYYYDSNNNNNNNEEKKKRKEEEKRMKGAERILKYKEITMETQCVWSIKQK